MVTARQYGYSSLGAAKSAATVRGIRDAVIIASKTPNAFGWIEYRWSRPGVVLSGTGWRLASRRENGQWNDLNP